MGTTHFWDGRTLRCGTVLKWVSGAKDERVSFIPRYEGSLFNFGNDKNIIANIPRSAVVKFDVNDSDALGGDSLILIMSDGTGKSPLLNKLNINIPMLFEQLSRANEIAKAAMAKAEVAQHLQSESGREGLKRALDEIQDIKKETQPSYVPGKRGLV